MLLFLQERGSQVQITCQAAKNNITISLSKEERKKLEQSYFSSFTQCKTVILENLGIEKIGLGAFIHLEKAKYLNLNKNYLREINQGMLSGLRSVEILLLADNFISVIHPESFVGMGNLEQIVLQDNMLSELQPGAFKGLQKLMFLNVGKNLLSMVNKNAMDPELIHSLDVGSHSLYLDLEDNPLTCEGAGDQCWIKWGREKSKVYIFPQSSPVPCIDVSGQTFIEYLDAMQC